MKVIKLELARNTEGLYNPLHTIENLLNEINEIDIEELDVKEKIECIFGILNDMKGGEE
jgi:hypothetical protein